MKASRGGWIMIIRKVEIKNFRGFNEKTFCFDDKAVVLLAAANGIGKTTMVDAIEWCLTGSIGRLKSAFDARSSNSTDRKNNAKGILKNSEAGEKDKVAVTLWIFDGEKEIILRREQAKDELDENASKVTVDKSEEKAKEFCEKYVNESFYNYHFCDVQKAFNIQSRKRKDIKDLFREFITNYDDQKNIADSLDVFAEDVNRYIQDKTRQKVKNAEIENLQNQVSEAHKEANHILYPEVSFYEGERNDVTSLSKDELNLQKSFVYKCGYKVAEEELFKLVTNENSKQKRSEIRKIDSYWKSMGDSIGKAIEAGLGNDSNTIALLNAKVRKLKDLELTSETIFQDSEDILKLENEGFTKDDFEADKSEIADSEDRIKGINNDIELLSKNNKILEVISKLSTSKKEIVDYRNEEIEKNGTARCPICGSESFATLDDSLLLNEADNYIRQNGEAVSLKEKEKKLLRDKIDELYKKIIDRAKDVVTKEIGNLEVKIGTLKALNDEVQPYFEEVKRIQEIDDTFVIDGLIAEKVSNLLVTVESEILEESEEKQLRDDYQRILDAVGYEYEAEPLKQTYEKVNNLALNAPDVTNFSYDVFVSKINAINSILSDQTLSDLTKKLEEYKTKNNNLDEEIEKLNKLQTTASSRADEIRDIVNQLSEEEYKNVGPAIENYYNKLSRFNYQDGIRIVQKEDGISIVDSKDKNIVNVLSNGQISVFMLAYFFAGISARNKREMMKVYFIDDLTACMDDVNMLAFMDLLKYQMSSKATMDQLFFVTCDDRISKLFKYKMNGHGIELCEFKESDFLLA